MEKMELYHLHKLGKHDRNWHERAEIEVKENFKNALYNRYQKFTTGISIGDGEKVNLYDLIIHLIMTKQMDEEMKEEIIKYAYDVSYYASLFKRETALENYRKDKNYIHPSRMHSIYLTDEAGIESWKTKLAADGKDLELYRVEVEGNIFKTSEFFIPDETLTYEKAYEESYKYWNPNFKKAPKDANEYLVQGKVKVLEKISKF